MRTLHDAPRDALDQRGEFAANRDLTAIPAGMLTAEPGGRLPGPAWR